MRKYLLLLTLMGTVLLSKAQDFTNKGKDFWIGYGNHVRMLSGGVAETMQIYITSDVNTTGRVEIPSIAFTQTFSVTANQVISINIPRGAALINEGLYNHGIHVTALKPIVVYSFIYVNAISGATLCLPTSTLGLDYYSINYTQVSNEPSNSYSYFMAIATDTGTTTVQINPSQNTLGGRTAGVPFTVNLTQGQVYQVLSPIDLTGSTIQSINNGSGCKKIAVFNGAGKIMINGGGTGNSSDNLYQQMYPTNTWGKTYLTTPSINTADPAGQFNYFRIFKSDPAAVVYVNGSLVPNALFVNNTFATLPASNQPMKIESDLPIMVSQYFTTQGTTGNGGQGDPEMIYLNPIEQTITKVTLNSMQPGSNTNINQHYINVIVKTSPGAINSFNIDGATYTSNFAPHPNAPGYSYARLQVTPGTHTVSCDTPFNAIAYGFGAFESYGYSAGTNLKDLYQFVSIQNDYGTVNFPAGCKNTPFKFSMTFPYQPLSIKWEFNGLFNDTTINSPVSDSNWVVNGRTLYRYKLNKTYNIPAIGTYPISVIANNPTPDGCSGLQEIEYDLQIFERPVADFNFTHTGCVTDSIAFTDATNGQGRTVDRWFWDYGDGNFGSTANPKHRFNIAGNKTVRHAAITDVGCLSDTMSKIIPISDPPIANFGISALNCERGSITFTDSSTISVGTLVKWKWDFGDGVIINATNGNAVQHTYATAGTYNVSLEVETNTGCKSFVFSRTLVVYPRPVADFGMPTVCIPSSASFTDLSTISNNTQSQFTYAWDFGDGQSASQKDPVHNYANAGPFNVKLTVTSGNGCIDDTTKSFTTIYPQPKIRVSIPSEKCFGDTVSMSVKIINPLNVSIKSYNVVWGSNPPTAVTLAAGVDSIILTHVFSVAGNQTVRVFVNADGPGGCLSDTVTAPIYINALPIADFSINTVTCEGQDVGFLDQSASTDGTVAQWNWNFGNGSTASIQNPTTLYSTQGNYTSNLIATSTKGCVSAPLAKPVVVNYLPVAKFGTPEVCLSDPFAQFTDSSSIGDNSQSQFRYNWNFGDANANAGNPNTSAQQNPRHRYIAVGLYNVQLIITSKDGCIDTTTTAFTVNGSIPLAGFSVVNATDLCANQEIAITDASTVDFGSIVKVEVFWDYGNDPTIRTIDDNPTPGKQYSHLYPEFGSPATRTFRVRYVAYSGINCINEITRIITVKASPQLLFDPLQPICEEVVPIQFTAARETAGLTGTGIYSGPGITNPGGTFSPILAKPGQHTIRYSYNATNGCSSFIEQSIIVHPTPIVDAGPDRVVLEGGFVQINAKGTGNNISVTWSPTVGLDNVKILNPKASPVEDITYRLTVTSAEGCEDSDDVFVKVLKKPKIPNAFSPNGDGINDTWVIEHLESYPGAVVEVFNRYGQLVYRTVNYSNPWNGTFNGNPLPVATYYWVINPKNGRAPLTGSVTIIR